MYSLSSWTRFFSAMTIEIFQALHWYVDSLVIRKDGDRVEISWVCRHASHRGYVFSVRVTDMLAGVLKLIAIENAAHQDAIKCLAASSSEGCHCEL